MSGSPPFHEIGGRKKKSSYKIFSSDKWVVANKVKYVKWVMSVRRPQVQSISVAATPQRRALSISEMGSLVYAEGRGDCRNRWMRTVRRQVTNMD